MRQLLLLRHAKSSWDDPKLADHARPLNPRGIAAAAAMAREIRRLGLSPDLVLVSSSRRTLQTLAALEPWDETPQVEAMDALYLAPAAELLGLLRRVAPTTRSVLLVGHNPGLHDLATRLAGAATDANPHSRRLAESYPSGTLTEFAVAGPWSELRDGAGRLTRFLTPHDVPEVTT